MFGSTIFSFDQNQKPENHPYLFTFLYSPCPVLQQVQYLLYVALKSVLFLLYLLLCLLHPLLLNTIAAPLFAFLPSVLFTGKEWFFQKSNWIVIHLLAISVFSVTLHSGKNSLKWNKGLCRICFCNFFNINFHLCRHSRLMLRSFQFSVLTILKKLIRRIRKVFLK